MNSSALTANDLTAGKEPSDLEELRNSIARVLGEECDSRALHAYIDGRSDLSRKIWTTGSELGWLCIDIPENDGGLDLGPSGSAVLHEELGFRAVPGPFIASGIVSGFIAVFGTAELKARWLPGLISGDVGSAIPATIAAPNAPEAVMGETSDQVVLLGESDARLALLPSAGGWSLVELPLEKVEPSAFWDRTRGLFAVDREVIRASCESPVSAGTFVGERFALAVAADSLGGARSIASQTLEYLKGRSQFGRQIASFQAIKHRVANIYALIATVEHAVAQAAACAQARNEDAWMWAALAKAEASDAFAFIASECVLLHGGVGYTWEYDPHIYLKRARLNEMLVMRNCQIRDSAELQLSAFTRDGRTTLELPAT